jgi:hypothetical protein
VAIARTFARDVLLGWVGSATLTWRQPAALKKAELRQLEMALQERLLFERVAALQAWGAAPSFRLRHRLFLLCGHDAQPGVGGSRGGSATTAEQQPTIGQQPAAKRLRVDEPPNPAKGSDGCMGRLGVERDSTTSTSSSADSSSGGGGATSDCGSDSSSSVGNGDDCAPGHGMHPSASLDADAWLAAATTLRTWLASLDDLMAPPLHPALAPTFVAQGAWVRPAGAAAQQSCSTVPERQSTHELPPSMARVLDAAAAMGMSEGVLTAARARLAAIAAASR